MFLYYKCYISIELTSLKKLMLIRQANQNSAIFATIDIFFKKGFKFQRNVCNRCHDLLMMSMNLSNIAILKSKGSDYRCIISRISKNKAINLMQNADLTEKGERL